MGIGQWIARRGARNVVKAMSLHYRQGQDTYRSGGLDDLPALCRDVVGSRYRALAPNEKEFAIIRSAMEDLEDFYDAAFLVVLAEGGVDQDLDPSLYSLYAETVALEVAKVEGIQNPEQDQSVLARLGQLKQKFAHIRSEAANQDMNEVREHLAMLKMMKR